MAPDEPTLSPADDSTGSRRIAIDARLRGEYRFSELQRAPAMVQEILRGLYGEEPTADVAWFSQTHLAVVDVVGLQGRGHDNVPGSVMQMAAERARLQGEMADLQWDFILGLSEAGLVENHNTLDAARERARTVFPDGRYKIVQTPTGYDLFDLSGLFEWPAYHSALVRIDALDRELGEAGWASIDLVLLYDP